MTILDEMAEFTVGATLGDVSPAHRSELKIRILASLGCAIGALDS
jgi:2-methylcitrate dehydratase